LTGGPGAASVEGAGDLERREQVRRQFPSRRPIHCLGLERLIRAIRKMSVNSMEIVTQWDLDRSVRDGKGREALGVTEADPALPGVLLISLNANLCWRHAHCYIAS
jgi:hypothetical protein